MVIYSGDDCFVGFHKNTIIHSEFVPVGKGGNDGGLEMAFSGRPFTLDDCTEGL